MPKTSPAQTSFPIHFSPSPAGIRWVYLHGDERTAHLDILSRSKAFNVMFHTGVFQRAKNTH